MKRTKWLSLLLAAGLLTGCAGQKEGIEIASGVINDVMSAAEDANSEDFSDWEDLEEAENTEVYEDNAASADASEDVSLTMLDVGQGLSVLLESDGHYMIYDGGNRKHSSYVVAYLKQHDVTELDYLFASHYDEDHIAGLVGVLNTAEIDEAVIPDYETDSAIYQSFMTATENAESVTFAEAGQTYDLGDAQIDVLYACDGSEEDENDKSTVIKVSCGDFSCVLTGDAESETETKLVQEGVNLDCTVYVVGHHGSSSSSTTAFVQAMSPELALISVGADNSYGHPTDKTLSTLNASGASIYRTDTHGVITVNYNGTSYEVETDYDGMPDASEAGVTDEASEDVSYVLNVSSMKFHLPDCSAVSQMSDSSKEFSTKTRDELISDGYDPCGMCKP